MFYIEYEHALGCAALTGVCGAVVDLCVALAGGADCTEEQQELLERLTREVMLPVRFVPLLPGQAREL